MPQDLPDWARPSQPQKRDRQPFDSRPDGRDAPGDYGGGGGYSQPLPPPDGGGPQAQVIWPAPGEDCGTCDVSGLTIDGVDCDSNPDYCELICCNFPAPDQCAGAYQEGPCAVPLSGQWILIFAAIALAAWKLT